MSRIEGVFSLRTLWQARALYAEPERKLRSSEYLNCTDSFVFAHRYLNQLDSDIDIQHKPRSLL